MKSAIIIGASSGIGRALAVTLSRDGYRVGVVAGSVAAARQPSDALSGGAQVNGVDTGSSNKQEGHSIGLIVELVPTALWEIDRLSGCLDRLMPHVRLDGVDIAGGGGMHCAWRAGTAGSAGTKSRISSWSQPPSEPSHQA